MSSRPHTSANQFASGRRRRDSLSALNESRLAPSLTTSSLVYPAADTLMLQSHHRSSSFGVSLYRCPASTRIRRSFQRARAHTTPLTVLPNCHVAYYWILMATGHRLIRRVATAADPVNSAVAPKAASPPKRTSTKQKLPPSTLRTGRAILDAESKCRLPSKSLHSTTVHAPRSFRPATLLSGPINKVKENVSIFRPTRGGIRIIAYVARSLKHSHAATCISSSLFLRRSPLQQCELL